MPCDLGFIQLIFLKSSGANVRDEAHRVSGSCRKSGHVWRLWEACTCWHVIQHPASTQSAWHCSLRKASHSEQHLDVGASLSRWTNIIFTFRWCWILLDYIIDPGDHLVRVFPEWLQIRWFSHCLGQSVQPNLVFFLVSSHVGWTVTVSLHPVAGHLQMSMDIMLVVNICFMRSAV
jgi:hypothetical protein